MTLNILVMAPDGLIWDQVVEEVVLPGKTGQIGVLEGHTPLVTSLAIGVLRIKVEEKWSYKIALGGFATILNNQVTVLVGGVEDLPSDNVQLEEADRLLKEANEAFETLSRSSNDKKEILQASQFVKVAKERIKGYNHMKGLL
jgi:F-type H+-transporting ATPase subunit epsilon